MCGVIKKKKFSGETGKYLKRNTFEQRKRSVRRITMRSQPQTKTPLPIFAPRSGVASLLVCRARRGGCMCCCHLWAEAWMKVGNVFTIPHRKIVRKRYMRSQTLGKSSAESLQELPRTNRPAQAAAVLLLFWFFSRSGTFATNDSLILALGWRWPLFVFSFFFSMNFLLFFQIQSLDEIVVLLSQRFLDLFKVRGQLFNSKYWDFMKSLCCWADCTDAGEIPKQHKASLLSIRLRLKRLVEGGGENVYHKNNRCHSAGNG